MRQDPDPDPDPDPQHQRVCMSVECADSARLAGCLTSQHVEEASGQALDDVLPMQPVRHEGHGHHFAYSQSSRGGGGRQEGSWSPFCLQPVIEGWRGRQERDPLHQALVERHAPE